HARGDEPGGACLLPRPWRAAGRRGPSRAAAGPAGAGGLSGGPLMGGAPRPPAIRGYDLGGLDNLLSAEAVERAGAELAANAPGPAQLEALAPEAVLAIDGLVAGYGAMEILHGIDLRLSAGQSLCLIGPNGAGKSTVLHTLYGFARIGGGGIRF